jgi:hypothetical protein
VGLTASLLASHDARLWRAAACASQRPRFHRALPLVQVRHTHDPGARVPQQGSRMPAGACCMRSGAGQRLDARTSAQQRHAAARARSQAACLPGGAARESRRCSAARRRVLRAGVQRAASAALARGRARRHPGPDRVDVRGARRARAAGGPRLAGAHAPGARRRGLRAPAGRAEAGSAGHSRLPLLSIA